MKSSGDLRDHRSPVRATGLSRHALVTVLAFATGCAGPTIPTGQPDRSALATVEPARTWTLDVTGGEGLPVRVSVVDLSGSLDHVARAEEGAGVPAIGGIAAANERPRTLIVDVGHQSCAEAASLTLSAQPAGGLRLHAGRGDECTGKASGVSYTLRLELSRPVAAEGLVRSSDEGEAGSRWGVFLPSVHDAIPVAIVDELNVVEGAAPARRPHSPRGPPFISARPGEPNSVVLAWQAEACVSGFTLVVEPSSAGARFEVVGSVLKPDLCDGRQVAYGLELELADAVPAVYDVFLATSR